MYKPRQFLIAVVCLIGASCGSPAGGDCAFCNTDVLNRQKFYEDNLVLALYTHKPILPGHCLIIPKRHAERLEMLTDEELAQMCHVIKAVHQTISKTFGTSSYLVLQKNGSEVGQSVPHVHFHYIPRQKGDNSSLKFLAKMYIANLRKPLSAAEMRKMIETLNPPSSSQALHGS